MQYMASQFMVLHRTRGAGMDGPAPISLQACHAYLEFWPQWDVLKFVEIMLAADSVLLKLLAKDRTKEAERTKNK